MKLVSPSEKYKAEFANFYKDFLNNDPENADYYEASFSNFEVYVKRLLDEEAGLNLREGYMPCSHFWMLSEDNTIIGAIRIRHRIDTEFLSQLGGHIGFHIAPSYRSKGYGKLMLKLVLPKAQALGLEKVLLTADEDNISSRKVIENNGGEFENIVGVKARYWISCN